jgi:polysaccharide chain length determinant protein (PEP-CTERM system associated)
MQPTEGFSVPRRTLDIEDYIDIMRRHKGWIFGPFLFTLVATVVGVYIYPDSYTSTGLIKIVPQKVTQNMVQTSVNSDMTDKILAEAQTIESHNTLTSIINTFGLYPKDKSRLPIEDVIDEMKGAINISPVSTIGGSGHQVPAFAIAFSYYDKHTAQKVVEDLTNKFIDQYNGATSDQTVISTQFFKDQADQARKQLDEVETRLTDFRVTHNGRLPDQVESNRQQLNTMTTNSQFYNTSLSGAQAQKLTLESNLGILKERIANASRETQEAPPPVAPKSQALAEAEREVEGYQKQLRELRQSYQETFPDVTIVKGRLADAEKKRDDIEKSEAEAKKANPVVRPVNQQAVREIQGWNEQIRQIQSAIELKDIEIEQLTKDLKRSNDQINQYQARIETIPAGTKEYDDLLRDRDMAKQKYEDMDAKLARAQTEQDLDSRKQGETLEILDSASLPAQPTEPKRPLDIAIGAGIGLLLGIVIAAAREMKDTSLKNLKDVRAYTQMSILGSIPLLENDFVVRRRRRLSWLGWTTACLAAAVVVSGSIVYYTLNSQ